MNIVAFRLIPNPRTLFRLMIVAIVTITMASCFTPWKTLVHAAEDQSYLRSGEQILAMAFCYTEDGARTISMAMQNDVGDTDEAPGASYRIAMSMRNDCHEARGDRHGPLATPVILGNRLWTIEPRANVRVQFWNGETSSGRTVFVWSSEVLNRPLE